MNISNALFKMAGRGIIPLALILAEAGGAPRHLEENTSAAPKPALSAQDQPKSEGYVTTQEPPAGLAPAKTLSPQQWRQNFDFLCKAIDETCATFEIKSINWDELHHCYQQRLDATTTTEQFYRLLFDLVRELHDGHAWLQNYHPAVPASTPGVTVDLFQDKPFVVAVKAGSEAARLGVKPGSEVLEIDGVSVTNRMERLRTILHGFSSERGFRRDACRRLLTGEKDSMAVVKLRSPDGHAETFRLPRVYELETPPPQACPFALTRQRFVHFGRLPSGLGYIRIVSFMGRQEIDDEFDKALEALRAAPGIILDIRDNRGGYSHTHIAGRLLQKPAPGGTSYVKNGPGHKDLERRDIILYPTGPWQYDGPVVLLVNDVTGSASDLFACYLRSAKRVVTVGSSTDGILSGQAAWAVLPCGLIVRISNSYICDSTGQPIEGRGNEPDVVVRPTITDFLTGKDPVLDQAAALLREKLRHNQAGGLPLPQSLSSPGG